MTFGKTIQVRRLEKGISLRKMAEQLDVTPGYLSRIEAGKVPAPAEEVVKRLAEHLDFNPDELLAEAGKVSDDLLEIIRNNPTHMAKIIRESATASAAISLGLPKAKPEE